MVNRNLVLGLDQNQSNWDAELDSAFAGIQMEDLDWGGSDLTVNQIVEGKVIRVEGDYVIVDVGFKSEGLVNRNEWEEGQELPNPGDTIRVLIEEVEDGSNAGGMPQMDEAKGMIMLSKRKAEKIEAWKKVMESVHEGDVVTGNVIRKIKGGLLVDIGVNVFLPASQVDIRRPADIGEYIGRSIDCSVLKIDEPRRNIVVSRRFLIEKERETQKQELLKQL
ncbi:MAG: S1 RNA-binding domain-containing protein, partial [Planctomycetia bacterium]|nr:S1 RNA-binding domain-containing protein [Planctomycetia bacterium]